MLIVVDSREQCPFPFAHERYGAKTKQGALTVGDYSLAGLEDKVAVERKSLPDLVACLGRERERFERELMRGAALDAFAVVCEGSWLELARGEYRSQLNPHAACQSVLAFTARYRVPFLFAGNPWGGGVHDVGIPAPVPRISSEAVAGYRQGARRRCGVG